MRLRRLLCLLTLLTMAVLLGLSPTAAADGYETWSGSYSFTLTINKNDPVTGKITKKTETTTGTVELYTEPDGPPVPVDGYYMIFTHPTQGLKVGIMGLTIISTHVPTAKPNKFIGVGAGKFFQVADSDQLLYEGPAYLDISSGTYTPGNIPTVTMTLKTAGGIAGFPENDGGDFIWHGATKVVLTKK